MKQEFKIQVPDGCSAKIEQQDGFLVVVFEPKEWKPKDGDVIAFGDDAVGIFKEFERHFHVDYATILEGVLYYSMG